MKQEEADFAHFQEHQLARVDYSTGNIDVYVKTRSKSAKRLVHDVGSKNQDGYIRIWCNRRLRMKHRLLFWLYHGYLPDEVDHKNNQRDDNSIQNLRPATRKQNTRDKEPRSYKQLTHEQVHEICKRIVAGTDTITKIGEDFGRSRTQVKGIILKKHWTEISDQYF